MKVIIYDFDGTLTPYPMVRYKILEKCNVGYDEMEILVHDYMRTYNKNIYESYYTVFFDILNKHNIDINLDNICYGSDIIEYSKGVIDYFNKYKDIKHYVVTSGLKDFIINSYVNKYLDDVYGVTVNYEEKKTDKLLTDKEKVLAIKKIIEINKCSISDVVYIGDGLTDKYAFSYIHNNGGKTIFINDKDNDNLYLELNKDNIIDYRFNRDYSIDSDIDRFISEFVEL